MSLSWELLTFRRVQVEKIKSYRGWVNPVCLFIQVIPQVFDNLSCERFCVMSWEALVWRVAVHSLSRIQLLATPWTLAHQAPPSPSPGDCSNSCPLSWWCHPTILSSVVSFSSCLQSFSASGSFLMSWFFTSGGQSIGVSASASVLPMNI